MHELSAPPESKTNFEATTPPRHDTLTTPPTPVQLPHRSSGRPRTTKLNHKTPRRPPATMDNFGVIELAGPKTAATPGWAYVPDAAPLHHGPSTGRKRAAARGQGLSLSDQSAREEARVRRELEGLDREGSGRDAIAVPARGRGEFSSVAVPWFDVRSFACFGVLWGTCADWDRVVQRRENIPRT